MRRFPITAPPKAAVGSTNKRKLHAHAFIVPSLRCVTEVNAPSSPLASRNAIAERGLNRESRLPILGILTLF